MANIGRAYGRIIPPENDDDGGGFIALAIERERERDRPADVHRGCRVSTRGSCARSVAKNGSPPFRPYEIDSIEFSHPLVANRFSIRANSAPLYKDPLDGFRTDGRRVLHLEEKNFARERRLFSGERERENKRRRRSKAVAKRRASVP